MPATVTTTCSFAAAVNWNRSVSEDRLNVPVSVCAETIGPPSPSVGEVSAPGSLASEIAYPPVVLRPLS